MIAYPFDSTTGRPFLDYPASQPEDQLRNLLAEAIGFTTWQFYEKTEQKESKVKNEILTINLSDDSLGRSAEINK